MSESPRVFRSAANVSVHAGARAGLEETIPVDFASGGYVRTNVTPSWSLPLSWLLGRGAYRATCSVSAVTVTRARR